MPNSATRPGKRERLINSAAELLHRQGVQRTTLAQIAEHADVPPGNVYYYFKTFAELVDAVIDHRQAVIYDTLARLDKRATPKAKLKPPCGEHLWRRIADEGRSASHRTLGRRAGVIAWPGARLQSV